MQPPAVVAIGSPTWSSDRATVSQPPPPGGQPINPALPSSVTYLYPPPLSLPRLPGAFQRLFTSLAGWMVEGAVVEPSVHRPNYAAAAAAAAEMSSISSHGPSSTTDTDGRLTSANTSNKRTTRAQDTPPASPEVSPSDRASKACCFCWCCCCSCSCLTVKNGEDVKNQSKETKLDNLCEKEEPPTLEEIKQWGESFDYVMQTSGGRKVFREFLRSEYSEENMLFWLACEELKGELNAEAVEEKARLIYEDYISILSPKEVSLDSRVREIINKNMVEPTPHTFDEAQLQIYTLMHRDSYPRFLNSQIYKRLLQ